MQPLQKLCLFHRESWMFKNIMGGVKELWTSRCTSCPVVWHKGNWQNTQNLCPSECFVLQEWSDRLQSQKKSRQRMNLTQHGLWRPLHQNGSELICKLSPWCGHVWGNIVSSFSTATLKLSSTSWQQLEILLKLQPCVSSEWQHWHLNVLKC